MQNNSEPQKENRSLNSSLNTSTGANEFSTVNWLNEEAIREGKQNMADIQEEEDLDTRCEHRPSYTPPTHQTTSKIANDLRNLALILGRQPVHTSTNVRHDDKKSKTQVENNEPEENLSQADDDWWNPIQDSTEKSLPTGYNPGFGSAPNPRTTFSAPTSITVEGWSKLRLIGYLQMVEPKLTSITNIYPRRYSNR